MASSARDFRIFIFWLAERLEQLLKNKVGQVRPLMIYCDDCLIIIDINDVQEIQEKLDACTTWAIESELVWDISKSHLVCGKEEEVEVQLQGERLQTSRDF